MNRINNKITHEGVVDEIDGDCIRVKIVQTSACASCKVSSHCNASESKEKLIEVSGVPDASVYHVGDAVVVSASADAAHRAVWIGFGIPLALMMVVLGLVSQLVGDEGICALAALASIIPYYFFVYLMRDRISSRLSFSIES